MVYTSYVHVLILFMQLSSVLLAETIIDLFNIEYSLTGSWLRQAEEQAYIFFVDFLDECDG